MKLFGLIGYPLGHSYSKQYFEKKFKKMGRDDLGYELFPLEDINNLTQFLLDNPEFLGLNVTIPYKEAVIPFLDEIDDVAKEIGSVNTISIIRDGSEILTKGTCTDAYGFRKAIEPYLKQHHQKALILGTGGGSKAVQYVFGKLGIEFTIVSRDSSKPGCIAYLDINKKVINDHTIIVNTSPSGMFPNVCECPAIPYFYLTSEHLVFDLIYNPEETVFLKRTRKQGVTSVNGLEMLYYQADRSWEIWEECCK